MDQQPRKRVQVLIELYDGPPPLKRLKDAECAPGPWVLVTGVGTFCEYAGAVNGGGAAALGRKLHDLLGVRDEHPGKE